MDVLRVVGARLARKRLRGTKEGSPKLGDKFVGGINGRTEPAGQVAVQPML